MGQDITLNRLVSFLGDIEGFKELPADDLETLIAPMVSITSYEPGQMIIKQGTEGRSLFILYDGRIHIDLQNKQGKTIQFSLDKGAIVGEMSLVSNQLTGANVSAETTVTMLTLDIETFQELMVENWRVTKAFAGLIGQRVINSFKR